MSSVFNFNVVDSYIKKLVQNYPHPIARRASKHDRQQSGFFLIFNIHYICAHGIHLLPFADYTGYCPDTCSTLYNPLCGRDGKIYVNRCQWLLKICETNNDWLFFDAGNDCFDGMLN